MGIRKRKKRPVALPGYPWRGKFKTMDEIDAYFSKDKVVCLRCGQPCVSLHMHLRHSHEKISADAYKEMYGIPWGRGLISKPMLKRLAYLMKKHKRDGTMRRGPSKAHLKRLDSKKTRQKHRPLVDAVIHQRHEHGLKMKAAAWKWKEKDFDNFLKRIKDGRTISEVSQDKDMPKRVIFDVYMRKNAAFQAKFDRLWNDLPFPVQARGRKFGERFKKEVIKLRKKGLGWSEIGRSLGVPRSTVITICRSAKGSG